jgi:hypothetical protein
VALKAMEGAARVMVVAKSGFPGGKTDHLGNAFRSAPGSKSSPYLSEAEMLQGAEGNNQLNRIIGQGEPLAAGDDGFILHGGSSGTDIDGGDGEMGEQPKDEMPVRTHVQDLPGSTLECEKRQRRIDDR